MGTVTMGVRAVPPRFGGDGKAKDDGQSKDECFHGLIIPHEEQGVNKKPHHRGGAGGG